MDMTQSAMENKIVILTPMFKFQRAKLNNLPLLNPTPLPRNLHFYPIA